LQHVEDDEYYRARLNDGNLVMWFIQISSDTLLIILCLGMSLEDKHVYYRQDNTECDRESEKSCANSHYHFDTKMIMLYMWAYVLVRVLLLKLPSYRKKLSNLFIVVTVIGVSLATYMRGNLSMRQVSDSDMSQNLYTVSWASLVIVFLGELRLMLSRLASHMDCTWKDWNKRQKPLRKLRKIVSVLSVLMSITFELMMIARILIHNSQSIDSSITDVLSLVVVLRQIPCYNKFIAEKLIRVMRTEGEVVRT